MAADLFTKYLGLELRNPIVAGACPLTSDLAALQRLEEAGIGAIVLPSLFQEQIQRDEIEIERLYEYQVDFYFDVPEEIADLNYLNRGAGGYLRSVEQFKRELSVPVIASLNGHSRGDWISHARLIEEAGADAIELNIYFLATAAEASSQDVEDQYTDLVAGVRSEISIPLAVKISPYFSALPHFARRLVDAGADGLVLFNRYLAPDIDLDRLQLDTELELSSPLELRLPMCWAAILRDHVNVSLAVTSGVQDGYDVIKTLLVGADVAMIASSLLRNGTGYVQVMLEQIHQWMEEHEYHSIDQIRGMLQQLEISAPTSMARVQYMRALLSYTEKLL